MKRAELSSKVTDLVMKRERLSDKITELAARLLRVELLELALACEKKGAPLEEIGFTAEYHYDDEGGYHWGFSGAIGNPFDETTQEEDYFDFDEKLCDILNNNGEAATTEAFQAGAWHEGVLSISELFDLIGAAGDEVAPRV